MSIRFASAVAPAITVLLTVVAGCAPPAPEALAPEQVRAVEAEVRAATEALARAVADHDAEAILAHYDASDDFVYTGVDDIRIGRETFARSVTLWHRRHPEVETTAEVVKVRVLSSDVAVVVLRGRSSSAGPLAWTRTLVRDDEDGRWRVVVEHEAWRQAPGPESYHGSMPPADSPASPVGEG